METAVINMKGIFGKPVFPNKCRFRAGTRLGEEKIWDCSSSKRLLDNREISGKKPKLL